MRYRHELKYKINKNSAQILKLYLSKIMDIDTNSYTDNTYKIRSLYFDNDSSDAYYEKQNGILYREKYRIRYYNDDDSFIRLECKIKNNNLTSKKQVRISKEICEKILNNDIYDINTNGLLQEFINKIKINHLIPSVIVDYTRLAYTYPVSDVRITFDYNIKSGRYNYNLFSNIPTYDVLNDEEVVLEVKFNEFLPESIAIILKTVPSLREAVSKFALSRSIK